MMICKEEDCDKQLRDTNRSGYCTQHYRRNYFRRYQRERRATDPAYAARNRAYQKAYREAHPEYAASQRDYMLKYQREHRSDPEYRARENARQRLRRAKKQQATED